VNNLQTEVSERKSIGLSAFCLLILFFFCIKPFLLFSQEHITQTIKGRVICKKSQLGIPGATIVIKNFEPVKATITDINGFYKISEVPIGRLEIECSYLGYLPVLLSNVILSSGKELVLDFELEETSFNLDEVVVKAYARKDQAVNRMAVISARSFTLEETGRYAGSYGDPARMAANYAGVMTGNDNRNDIVIRGNSSIGILWRLDDIEIPNPSHYAALGTTGGPITILNTNLLANSDFLSGAFPAEFGNALSGVFDLKMRNGNSDKREHWFQTGWNGLEFGTEGPFSKQSKASYVFAYRYSLLDVINRLGVNLPIDPKYQDLNFKLYLPYKKGKFDIIGLGGKSGIQIFDSHKEQKDWMFDAAGENLENTSAVGIIALTNRHFFNDKTRLKSALTFSASEVKSRIDTFSLSAPNLFLKAGEESAEQRWSIATALNKKLSTKTDIDFGVVLENYNFSYKDSTFRKANYRWDTNTHGQLGLCRAYVQGFHQLNKHLKTIVGLHFQYLNLIKKHTLEPRFALKWDINALHALNFGVGWHSQMPPRMLYFVQSQLANDSYTKTNTNLDFSKSFHAVLGYDYMITDNLRLKSEVYYQYLYNIPVKQSIGAYSALNIGVEYFVGREDSLINAGFGENYGLEMTLERFFKNNYFFLMTASLFNSSYVGSDDVKRATAFNSNYLCNIVAGKEYKIGRRKNGVLILGGRFTWNGGRPYVPFDVAASIQNGYEVLDWQNAYVNKHADYKRFSLRVGIRRNKPKYSSELVFDMQYRTDYTNIYTERIDVQTGKLHNYQKMGWYPLSTWRINF